MKTFKPGTLVIVSEDYKGDRREGLGEFLEYRVDDMVCVLQCLNAGPKHGKEIFVQTHAVRKL